ncbi:MAG TPA: PAS domain S-box protein [Thermoanaerobaculia bacterium]|nr:PAS domain S-box protein [Thermoanaerobaculia bacterium]
MTIVTLRSRLFDLFAFHRRPAVEQQNTAAGPPTLHRNSLSTAFCFGAIAIGVIALIGYALGNASIASLGTNGKPVAAVAALAFIVLGAGLLALRSPVAAGLLTARRAALAVVVLAVADLLSAAFSRHIEEWQVWAARGGVIVHPYLVTGLLLLALGSALVFITTQRDFAGHVIGSAVLLISLFILLGHVLKIPSFLDRSKIAAPVAATGCGLVLISLAVVVARPRGWVVPLLSRTPAGLMSRLLLPAAIVVPLLAFALRDLNYRWFAPEAGLTVFVAIHAFFGAAIVLGVGVVLLRRNVDRIRLASIVDSSNDAIIGTSSAGLIESWNAGAENMYGYMAAEAIGRSATMLAPPERHGEAPLILERIQRGERIDPFETVRVAKDGRRIDVWLSVSPVLDDEDNVVGASSIAHDITGRKKAGEVIRLQAEQYATILATSSDGFWLVDLEGRLLDVNESYCRMSGYSREELLELRIPDIEALETPEETASRIQSTVESGVAHFETKHRTKDDRILDVEISVSFWRAAGRMLVFSRDITRRKQEQEALRRSEERLQLAQQAGGIGHFSWDIQNNTSTWSDEMMALYGLPPGAFGGQYESWRERVFPDDLPAAEAAIQQSLTSGEFTRDFRVVWPDASIHWLQARARVFFSEDGKPLRMVGVNMDISERVRAEEALRISEAALKEAQCIAHVGHWEWSVVTGAVTWSDETYRILGIPQGSVTASYELLLRTIVPEDRRRFEDEVARAITSAGEGDIYIDLGITTPAGAALVISARVFVDRDAGGEAVTLHGTIQDITRRVATAQALRDSEAALAEAQQIAHIGSWILYPESGELFASAETFRMFALDPLPVVPVQLFLERIHEEDQAHVAAGLAASRQTGMIDFEFRIVTPQGTRMAHAIARQRESGEPRLSLIGTTQDITEWKAAEEALRQHSEILERSNLELERFNRLAVGRELRMIELKRQINDLCAQLGQPASYVLPEERVLAKETS